MNHEKKTMKQNKNLRPFIPGKFLVRSVIITDTGMTVVNKPEADIPADYSKYKVTKVRAWKGYNF